MCASKMADEHACLFMKKLEVWPVDVEGLKSDEFIIGLVNKHFTAGILTRVAYLHNYLACWL